jgi:hypothetical protein
MRSCKVIEIVCVFYKTFLFLTLLKGTNPMTNKLEELRSRLKQEQEKTKKFEGGDKSGYQFWNIPDGEYSSIRFLPNGNDSADGFFWVEKIVVKLPFAGVRGKSTNQIMVQVPCMLTYGENCPIQDEIKPLWKTDEDTARIYYKKKSFILHGFVRKNAVKDDQPPESPIRRFNINSKLMKNIQAGLMDPDMEDMPTDVLNGSDFHIYKTMQGKFADYSTSKWARKSSPLTEEEALAIEKYGLADLTTYLPKKPDEQALAVIMDMFVDSMNGEAYDLEKYGKFYKPFGLDDGKATVGAGTHEVVSKTSEEETAVEAEDEVTTHVDVESAVAKAKEAGLSVKKTASPTVASGNKQSVQDLLAQLKNRKK